MFEGGGALGPIMDMAKSMFNMPIDSQMINEKLGPFMSHKFWIMINES